MRTPALAPCHPRGAQPSSIPAFGGSCIVAPTGQTVVQALTLGDELVVARCDLDLAKSYKESTFNFARHRQPAQYRMIVERTGAQDPE